MGRWRSTRREEGRPRGQGRGIHDGAYGRGTDVSQNGRFRPGRLDVGVRAGHGAQPRAGRLLAFGETSQRHDRLRAGASGPGGDKRRPQTPHASSSAAGAGSGCRPLPSRSTGRRPSAIRSASSRSTRTPRISRRNARAANASRRGSPVPPRRRCRGAGRAARCGSWPGFRRSAAATSPAGVVSAAITRTGAALEEECPRACHATVIFF